MHDSLSVVIAAFVEESTYFWTFKIGDLITIVAILLAPLLALRVQGRLQLRQEARTRKLEIFKTLMSTRRNAIDIRHVEALNMIDIEFASKSMSDVEVRKAGQIYLDLLNTPGQSEENRRDRLAEMLSKMGRSLGYDFDFTYIKEKGYYPLGHDNRLRQEYNIDQGLLNVLEGKTSLKMEVVKFPEQPRAN